MQYALHESPIGPLLLAGDADGLRVLAFAGARFAGDGRAKAPVPVDPAWEPDRGALTAIRAELDAYFAGRLRAFTVPVRPGGTAFQGRVWAALQRIPYGETISYQDLADRIGNPRAVRAVGLANGANPVAIVIPCHRVIGRNGSLVGFGGGLPIKQALLDLERGQRRLL
ncbi:MAG: methylated-DNA--[protein]-cysteine S-methyltransferase [Vicinamibacterales bacterium]